MMLKTLFLSKEDINTNSEGFKFFRSANFLKVNEEASEYNALSYSTIYSCINVLSDDIAKLPLKIYESKENKKQEITTGDVHQVLRIRPNKYMSPYVFLKLLMTDVCLHGNFYAFINRNVKGEIEELLPLTSTKTKPVVRDGCLFYQTLYKNKDIMLFDDEVIHIKGLSMDGLVGISPIEAIKKQLNSSRAADDLNLNLLTEGGVPKGVLSVQGSLSQEAKRIVREQWNKTNKGQSVAILDQGMEYKQIGLNTSDMDWLASQKFNQQQISAIFKIPLHKINNLEKATYSNIESQSLDYVKNTLQPHISNIEYELTYKLFTNRNQYVKFNMDSELRGDSEARAKVNAINFQNGFKTINEIRAINEDSPLEDKWADQAFTSLNLAPMNNIEAFHNNHYGEKLNGHFEPKGGDDHSGEASE